MPAPVELLRRADVERRTALSRATIYRRMALGAFPAPVRIPGSTAVRWRADEIDAWIAACAPERDTQGSAR